MLNATIHYRNGAQEGIQRANGRNIDETVEHIKHGLHQVFDATSESLDSIPYNPAEKVVITLSTRD